MPDRSTEWMSFDEFAIFDESERSPVEFPSGENIHIYVGYLRFALGGIKFSESYGPCPERFIPREYIVQLAPGQTLPCDSPDGLQQMWSGMVQLKLPFKDIPNELLSNLVF